MDRTEDTVSHATGEMASNVRRLSDRAARGAQGLARRAEAQIARVTGQPVDRWAASLERAVRGRPLGAIAAALAVGYILGKLVWRR
jgi:hypothetical protein